MKRLAGLTKAHQTAGADWPHRARRKEAHNMQAHRMKSVRPLKARGVLLAIVAMFAISAVATASASALPEFKPVPTKKKFTASAEKVILETPGFEQIVECTKSSITGEVTGARTVGNAIVTLTGCSAYDRGTKCAFNSKGAKSGEIVTKPLKGELGTVAKAQAFSGVGLQFGSETSEWYTQEGACVEKAVVEGDVAAEIGAPGNKSVTHELAFDLNEKDQQKIKEITLDSGTLEEPELVWGAATQRVHAVYKLTFEEAVEI
jgi:hypothetical protein